MYGASLGLHTTVNMGVKLRNPIGKKGRISFSPARAFKSLYKFLSPMNWRSKQVLTSNRQSWTARRELKKIPSFSWGHFAHDLKKISHAPTVHVETVVGLDRVHER